MPTPEGSQPNPEDSQEGSLSNPEGEHHDLTTPEGVVALMESSASKDAWNSNAERVLAANEGDYPEFWFQTINVSGLLNRKEKSWL